VSVATDGDPPLPVFLFGDYPWNKRHCRLGIDNSAPYEERCKAEPGVAWWDRDVIDESTLPPTVSRVKDWDELVEAVKDILAKVQS
jgi:hypothetical protein